jgi:hypothetical protein
VTHEATYASNQDTVAGASRGRLIPKGDGSAVVQVSVKDPKTSQTLLAWVQVTAGQFDISRQFDFTNDVVPARNDVGAGAAAYLLPFRMGSTRP